MVLCDVKYIEQIAKYLEIPQDQYRLLEKEVTNINHSQPNGNIENLATFIQALTKASKHPDGLGEDKETQALTRQWLEYVALYGNYADSPANAKRVLKELNTVLRDNTHITGTRRTVADIALYYALYTVMKELSHQEKAQYVHTSRWFDNLQQDKKLRQTLDVISFNLLHLFLEAK